MKKILTYLAVGLGLLLSAGLALAQDAAPKVDSGDTAWMLTSTLLVILMTIPGLALFYGGLARSKNALSVLMQVFVVFSLISILWAIYGYTLAFGGGGAEAIQVYLETRLKPLLLGEDPRMVGKLWDRMFRADRGIRRVGLAGYAVAALDIVPKRVTEATMVANLPPEGALMAVKKARKRASAGTKKKAAR